MRIQLNGSDVRRWAMLAASIGLAVLAHRAGAGCGSGDATCPGPRPTCSEGPSDCCGDVSVAATCANGAWACPDRYVFSCSGYFVPLAGGCSSNTGGGGGGGGGTAGTQAVAGRGGAGGGGGMAGTPGGGMAGAAGNGAGAGGATSCATAQAPSAPCAAGWYHDVQTICTGPSNQCSETGDGLCYRMCFSDAECTDACFSKCTQVPAFNSGGGDGASYYVCRKP